MNPASQFTEENGILIPEKRPVHRQDEYNEEGFYHLLEMQRNHFWYKGRHELLLNILQKEKKHFPAEKNELAAIDIGGGCGGWLEHLHDNADIEFTKFALGDSSLKALTLAGPVVQSFAERYQIDLLDLPWEEKWDIVFLLDVLEHIPDHKKVLCEIRRILRPGGLLFITTPALKLFWTYNDDAALHQRRYSKKDFKVLAKETDFEIIRSDYFMFFLSPALFISRLLTRPPSSSSPEELQSFLQKTHKTPSPPVNWALTKIFKLEASLVNHIKFPWGTSIFTLFKRK